MGEPLQDQGQSTAMGELHEAIKSSMDTIYQVPMEQLPNTSQSKENISKKRKNKEGDMEVNTCKQIIYSNTSQQDNTYLNSLDNNLSQQPLNSTDSQLNKLSKNVSSTPMEYNAFFIKCAENRYSSIDKGPLFVYAETKDNSRLHPMKVGKLIRSNSFSIYKNIPSIKSIGKNRVKILINDNFSEVNRLIEEQYWSTHNIACYIPSFYLYRQGVIRDVDTSLTETEIINYALSEVTVVQVKRIYKIKELESKEKIKIPTPVVIISFRGTALPIDVKLLGVRCKVEPYVQRVIQCYNCLRYGHTSRVCKNNVRCERCGSTHRSAECREEVKCIFCHTPHRATDRQKCLEYNRQVAIKIIMTNQNMTFPEAAEYHRRENPGSYAAKAKVVNVMQSPPPLSQYPQLNYQSSPQNEVYSDRTPERLPHKENQRPREYKTSVGRRETPKKDGRDQMQQHISNNINIPASPIINSQIYKNNVIVNLIESIMGNINKIVAAEQPSPSNEHLLPMIQPLVYKAINETITTFFTQSENEDNMSTISETDSL